MKKLIVGLGNPGPRYTWTRHNLGFMVLEELGTRQKVVWRNSASNHGLLSKVVVNDIECSLLMPMTYMNNSGLSVSRLSLKRQFALEDVLVVCDDLSLAFGKIRLRPEGSAGGHNGLKSIIKDLGSNQFARLRLGIGGPKSAGATVDYVLSDFTRPEKHLLPEFINHALDCATCWVAEGAQVAMNRFN